MKILGKPYDVVAPTGYMTGAFGIIPIASVNASFTVGSIPTCSVSIPIEYLDRLPKKQDSNPIQVIVTDDEETINILFTGYFSGPRGRVSITEANAGISLVHLARDMDQTRTIHPGSHPGGINDFNYFYRLSGDTDSGDTFIFEDQRFFDGKSSLPENIIKGIIKTLEEAEAGTIDNLEGTIRIESLQPAIALLKSIKVLNGKVRGEVANPLTDESTNSINAWVRSRVTGSFSGMRSVWDTVASIFAEFGMYLICDHLGEVKVSADLSTFAPAKENYLGGDYITSFDWRTSLTRNISQVNLVCDNITGSDSSQAAPGESLGSLATYPSQTDTKEPGGILTLQLPGWLNPLTAIDMKQLTAARIAFAKQLFFMERNKMKVISIAGPLAPNVTPGTTCLFAPYTAMRALSGLSIKSLERVYSGYCYQIDHVFDANEKVLQTVFSFRNVVDVDDKEVITEHPVFSDVAPFAWE